MIIFICPLELPYIIINFGPNPWQVLPGELLPIDTPNFFIIDPDIAISHFVGLGVMAKDKHG